MATSREKTILKRESPELSQAGASDTKRDTSKSLEIGNVNPAEKQEAAL